MPASSKEFLDIQATIECGFTLKSIYDMARTYSQMHHTDNYSEHSSIIWPVWPNGWVFVSELSGFGFKSSCSHLSSLDVADILDQPLMTRFGKKWFLFLGMKRGLKFPF